MNRKGSDVFVQTLEQYQIRYIFGNPGTTELPIIQSAGNCDSVDYIMSMHEDIAVASSTGYSLRMYEYYSDNKTSMPVSVANLHTTPGLLHGAANTYNSSFDQAPIILTTGSQDPDYEENNPALSGEREDIMRSIVKSTMTVENANNIPSKVRKAVRIAMTPPTGPVYLDIPLKVQKEKVNIEIPPLGKITEDSKFTGLDINNSLLESIEESENPTIFVGDGIKFENQKTIDSIVRFSENIGAKVYGETLCSRSVYPYSNSNWIGSLSANEDPTQIDSDLNIHIGCITNNSITKYNKQTSPETIIISNDKNKTNNRDRCDYSIIGHMGSIVSEINNQIDYNLENYEDLKRRFDERRNDRLEMFSSDNNLEGYIPKHKLAESINRVLNDDIIFDEGITSGFVLRNYLSKDSIDLYGLKGGGLGQGIGASIGLAVAEEQMNSDTNIISYIGDGTFHYYPQGLYTAAKYTDSITFIIPDNSGYEILQESDMIESSNDSLRFGDVDIESISESYKVPSDTYSFDLSIVEYIEKKINEEKTNLITVPVC